MKYLVAFMAILLSFITLPSLAADNEELAYRVQEYLGDANIQGTVLDANSLIGVAIKLPSPGEVGNQGYCDAVWLAGQLSHALYHNWHNVGPDFRISMGFTNGYQMEIQAAQGDKIIHVLAPAIAAKDTKKVKAICDREIKKYLRK